MTREQAKKEIKRFAEKYRVHLIFSKNLGPSGWARLREESVTISSDQTIVDMFSAAAHEICHILNKREGRYRIYHDWTEWPKDGSFSSAFLSTSHRAELYTDSRARKLLKLNYPHLKYLSGYKNTKADKIRFRKQLNPKEDWE